MMPNSNFESMQERARLKPNSTESIALIAMNDEHRRVSRERRAKLRARLQRAFMVGKRR